MQDNIEHSALNETDVSLINNSFHNITTTADTQISSLLQHQQKISTLVKTLNVETMKKRYHAKRSYLSVAIDWLGRQSLWVTLALGAVSIGIGMFFSIPIVLSIVLYAAIVFLCHDYVKNAEASSKILFDNLFLLQQSLVDSVTHINDVSTILQQNIVSLKELHGHLTDVNSTLQGNNLVLTTQLKQFETIITTLKKNQTEYETANADLNVKLQTVYTQLQNQQNSISLSAQSLTNIDIALGRTCLGFDKSIAILDQLPALMSHYETLTLTLEKKIAEQNTQQHNAENIAFFDTQAKARRTLDSYHQDNNEPSSSRARANTCP